MITPTVETKSPSTSPIASNPTNEDLSPRKHTGIIFGKGPSFCPSILTDLKVDVVIAINEAIYPVVSYRRDAWCAFGDFAIAEKLKRTPKVARMWCHKRYRDLFDRATTYDLIPADSDVWMTITREESNYLCINKPYSSSRALWLMWLMQVDRVYLNGIGDLTRSYHPMFSDTPQTDGEMPLVYLSEIASVKHIELIRINPFC